MPQTAFQTSDGVDLCVEDTGPADAPVTVLLAHGWTSDNRVWDAVFPRLAERVRVVRFDHRGHGSSGHAPDPAIDRLGDDLAELIEALAPAGRLVLVGHSMGGMAMMALAARHPDLVRSRAHAAFFVSTSSGRMREITFGLPRPVAKAGQALMREQGKRRARRAASVEAAPASPAPKPPRKPSPLQLRAQRAFLRWLLFGAPFQRADLLSVADQLGVVHGRSAAALRSSINRHEAAEAVRVYRDVPTQVLTGARDRLIPAEHSRAIAAELPDAELVVYHAAGHMLPYERADDLVARILTAAGRA
ncbi:alpha/beta fold hydrolase [Actinokineospora guangxiensis]|uniref:Alpha/beta fold hydrolase n=1 Tax=Actinokineospora guangxiensis TaxID=1490288 RepID=A0ABW0ELU7_9PSEU